MPKEKRTDEWDLKGLSDAAQRQFAVTVSAAELSQSHEAAYQALVEKFEQAYEAKRQSVGAELMAPSSFPDSLQELCRFHPEPQHAPLHARECSLVHIARQCALSGDPDTANLAFVAELSPATLEYANLTAPAVARVESGSYQHLVEAVELLLR